VTTVDKQAARSAGYALRTPCKHCPFRSDIDPYLHPERAQEIAQTLLDGGSFHCHKTVDYTERDDEPEDERGQGRVTADSQQCAGALATMERGGHIGQGARIAARLGLYDPDNLDPKAPVYGSLPEWVAAHRGGPRTVEFEGETLEYAHCGVAGPGCEDPAGYAGGSGAYANMDEPTCHPIDDCCSFCGHTMCTACRAEDQDGEPICVYCAEDDDE
jgi:hypothetical protein